VRTRDFLKAWWLYWRLKKRIKRVVRTEDHAPVLDSRAVDQAGELRRLFPHIPHALAVVGLVHWMRIHGQDPDDTEQDRVVATEVFRELKRTHPDWVPQAMREFLDEDHARRQTGIRLITPRTLLAGTELPRYRELTDFVTWHPDDERPLVFVSHRWITATHPDPDGVQFLELLRRLKDLLAEHPELAECGVFYDYWSMPQQPRSPEETEIFQRELGRLGELIDAADHVIILSEGYTDYRDRAWCVFEAFVASTSRLDWAEKPASNLRFFPDQQPIEADLAFLRTTMFQTVVGHEVKFLTAWHHRYRPDMKEAEAISAIFHHLGTCRTTHPADRPLVKLQLVRVMNLLDNLTPYGRLLLGINKFFDTTYCVLTENLTPLPATLHFRQPDWPRIPAYHQTGRRERHDGPFCLSPEQAEILSSTGGSSLSALRFAFSDLERFRQAEGWEEFYVPATDLIYPADDPFPTIDHLVHTILELGSAPLINLQDDDEHVYFPLVDPGS
jgi:hypothetical protein